jgi:hypothetical protein
MFNRAFTRPKDRYFQSYVEDIQIILYSWLCSLLRKLMYDISVKYDYIYDVLLYTFRFNVHLTSDLVLSNIRIMITNLLIRWIFHSMKIFIIRIRHDKVRYRLTILAILFFHRQCRMSIKAINYCIFEYNQILMKSKFKYRFTNLYI